MKHRQHVETQERSSLAPGLPKEDRGRCSHCAAEGEVKVGRGVLIAQGVRSEIRRHVKRVNPGALGERGPTSDGLRRAVESAALPFSPS